MKIAVCSDVHGNYYAFKEMLESMQKNGVQQYLFCGDICGYYYNQNEIINRIRNINNFICVLGNHDKKFLDFVDNKLNMNDLSVRDKQNFEKLARSITDDNLSFLKSLDSKYVCTIDGLKIAMYHGTPWDSLYEYCYPDSDLERYKGLDFDYIFQGHTHYRMHKVIGNIHLINPGSVGQPRDGKLPSYVLLDTSTREIEFISIKYDISTLISEIHQNEENPGYLLDVLFRSAENEE